MKSDITEIDDPIFKKFSRASVLAYFENATNIFEQAVEMVEWINQEVDMDDDDSDASEASDDLA
jgi:hypothetical protein|tara:strand:+ start:235 stop:426 length:192 start_codon:yes stop_codon:yes gene_type:complete